MTEPSPPPSAVIQFRIENGLCYLCGAKCYDIINEDGGSGDEQDDGNNDESGQRQRPRRRLEPLTIEGEVHRGRCLLCQPLPFTTISLAPKPESLANDDATIFTQEFSEQDDNTMLCEERRSAIESADDLATTVNSDVAVETGTVQCLKESEPADESRIMERGDNNEGRESKRKEDKKSSSAVKEARATKKARLETLSVLPLQQSEQPNKQVTRPSAADKKPPAETASTCSTLTNTAADATATAAKNENNHNHNEQFSLLSEYKEGSRHGCLVFHKNDRQRKVGEVIMEKDSTYVEVAINGGLRKYRATHLFVVPSDQFKSGDFVLSNDYCSGNAQPKRESPRNKVSTCRRPQAVVSSLLVENKSPALSSNDDDKPSCSGEVTGLDITFEKEAAAVGETEIGALDGAAGNDASQESQEDAVHTHSGEHREVENDDSSTFSEGNATINSENNQCDDKPSNAVTPSVSTRSMRATRSSKRGKNPFSDFNLLYLVKFDETGGFDNFLLNNVPTILESYGEKLPNLSDRFMSNDFFSQSNFGENADTLRQAFVGRMRELHGITGADGCLFKYVKPTIQRHQIEISGESVSGYDTIHNIPVAKALKFVRELDDTNINPGRRLRHGGYGGEWEPMIEDQGFKVYYYRTHDDCLADQVINVWAPDRNDKHGCIATDIRKWPAIPPVFTDIGKKVETLYGRSFRKNYFLGQIQVSKMECNNPKELPASHRMDHNKYSGNRLASHHDPAREGDVIVTILLAENIIFRLYNGSKVVKETELAPGSAYCIRCPEEHCFDAELRNVQCQMQMCPRHGLRHEIECSHPSSCDLHHPPDSVTERLPHRRGPRFAAVLRYFKR